MRKTAKRHGCPKWKELQSSDIYIEVCIDLHSMQNDMITIEIECVPCDQVIKERRRRCYKDLYYQAPALTQIRHASTQKIVGAVLCLCVSTQLTTLFHQETKSQNGWWEVTSRMRWQYASQSDCAAMKSPPATLKAFTTSTGFFPSSFNPDKLLISP